jgi:hypothetical protein
MLDIPKAQEEFEDIKGVIRICKSTVSTMAKRKRTKGQKDKQRSTKHTRNYKLCSTTR